MHRSRLPLLTLAATLALASPAAAERTAKFTVAFEGTAHTTWNVPAYQAQQDCYRTTMVDGHGEETWHVASTGTNKVLAQSNGYATQFQYGSWKLNDPRYQNGMKAKGQVARSYVMNTNFTAGTCGVTMKPLGWDDPPVDKPDCGTLLIDFDVQLGNTGLRALELTPDVLVGRHGVREKVGFDHCDLFAPKQTQAGTWPVATGRPEAKQRGRLKPIRGWFDGQKEIVASGRDRYADVQAHSNGTVTTTTTIEWKMTFTRVR
jgi:hypothetical protein